MSLQCEFCGENLPPNGNYLHSVQGGLVHSYCYVVRENQRLREVIIDEGIKWAKHHTDPEKIKYWRNFARKANR